MFGVLKGLFFQNVKIKTFIGWEGDFGFFITNDENVTSSGSESLSIGILQVDNIEATQMSFNMEDSSNSTDVVTTSSVGQMSWLVRDPADDLIVFQIVFDGVSFIDVRVWESDGSGIVSDNVWNLVWTDGFFNNFAEFEVSFRTFNADEGESTLFIIQKSKRLSGFNNGQEIHKTDWEFSISSNFMIDFKSCLFILSNDGDLSAVSCQSETISEIK